MTDPRSQNPGLRLVEEGPHEGEYECRKCESISGNDWSQCQGSCPVEGSPHFDPDLHAPPEPPTYRFIVLTEQQYQHLLAYWNAFDYLPGGPKEGQNPIPEHLRVEGDEARAAMTGSALQAMHEAKVLKTRADGQRLLFEVWPKMRLCGGRLQYEVMGGVMRVYEEMDSGERLYNYRCPDCGDAGTNNGRAVTCRAKMPT